MDWLPLSAIGKQLRSRNRRATGSKGFAIEEADDEGAGEQLETRGDAAVRSAEECATAKNKADRGGRRSFLFPYS